MVYSVLTSAFVANIPPINLYTRKANRLAIANLLLVVVGINCGYQLTPKEEFLQHCNNPEEKFLLRTDSSSRTSSTVLA